MKRKIAIGLVGLIALVGLGFVLSHQAATPAMANDTAVSADTILKADTTLEKKCDDYPGYYGNDKCDNECAKKGKKCTKKQMCGNEPRPWPGYCWKCI